MPIQITLTRRQQLFGCLGFHDVEFSENCFLSTIRVRSAQKMNYQRFDVFLTVQEILCNQPKNSFSTKVVVYNCCILKNDKVGFLLGPSNMFARFIPWLVHCSMIPFRPLWLKIESIFVIKGHFQVISGRNCVIEQSRQILSYLN